MINNLETQKRWLTKSKPQLPPPEFIKQLLNRENPPIESVTIATNPRSTLTANIMVQTSSPAISNNNNSIHRNRTINTPGNSDKDTSMNESTLDDEQDVIHRRQLGEVQRHNEVHKKQIDSGAHTRLNEGPRKQIHNETHKKQNEIHRHNEVSEKHSDVLDDNLDKVDDSDIIASYESTSKRQVCEIESDDELDQLLSKKSKTDKENSSVFHKPQLHKTGRIDVLGNFNPRTSNSRTPDMHLKTITSVGGTTKTYTNDDLYLKYINYQQLKSNLLTERYMIFESSSISLDDKQKFIQNTFNEKYNKLETVLSVLAKLLPNINKLETNYHQLETDVHYFLNYPGNSQIVQLQSIQIPDLSRIYPGDNMTKNNDNGSCHSDNDDFSDFEITQINQIEKDKTKGVIDLSSDDIKDPQNLPVPSAAQPASPILPVNSVRTPVHSDELEDEFGVGEMEGLRTPSQEVDNDDTDLSGFIDFENTSVLDEAPDVDYRSDLESIDETQDFRISKDELEDLKLSQEVADNYGIEYVQDEEPEEEDDMNDFDMTTQLNDEREVNYDVIEISDTLDLEDLTDVYKVKPEPTEKPKAVPFDDFDDFDDLDEFDTNGKNGQQDSNEYDDEELTELGITTSKDIIKEYERNFPGCQQYIKEIYSVLNKTFKLQNFRSNQFEAIFSLLQGKDVFVLMPTGGGKSLCYQLPALIKVGPKNKGTTIVISPLISLMQDQVEHLRAKNVKAGMINSKNNYQEKKQMMELLRLGELDLVYLSPEMINSSHQIQRIIKQLHDNRLLSKVIVDEAHCISSWGHDFRPDYKGMNFFRVNYPDIPIMALTATANEKVRLDIIHHLNMQQPVVLKQSFNRINLYYEVKMKTTNYLEELKQLLVSKYNDQTGIIYCHSKQACEQISLKLNQFGLNTSYYHAGMSTDDRFKVQLDWQQERVRIICATIAFGMGIDKPNVRFVIHSFIPRNLEGYYQETGRAGRDGLKSDCIMYYSYKDARTLQLMIQRDEEYSEVTKENHLNKLRQVIQFCENKSDCRRKQVLLYFNEVFNPKDCMKQCDACVNAIHFKSITKDVTEVSKDMLRLVRMIEKDKVTLLYCQDIFKGLNYSKITKNGHNQLPFHGRGKSINKLELERIFFHLISEDCLVEYSVFKGGFASNYVKLGKNAEMVLNGGKKIFIQLTEDSGSNGRKNIGGNNINGNVGNGTTGGHGHGFVSAKTNQPIRLPNNNYSNLINKFNESHIDKCFKELNTIRIQKRNELNFQNCNSIITDSSLKKLAILLPTSKQEFKKFVNNNDQLSYFIYFKSKLMQLSNERKQLMKQKSSTSNSTSQKSRHTKKSSYFKKRNKQKAMPI